MEVEVGGIFGAVLAKVKVVFGKDEFPRQSNLNQRRALARVARQEIKKMEVEEKASPNVVLDTVLAIANKERKKAIREGRYADAIVASIVETVGNDEKKKLRP